MTSAAFDAIRTEQLTIARTLYPLTWGAHAPGIQLLEANKAAKQFGGATAAVLGAAGYIIGTDAAAWDIRINVGTRISAGIALGTRNLTTAAPGPDVAGAQFSVAEGDMIRFSLSAGAVLTIMPLHGTAAASTSSFLSLVPFTGQTMYPWLCNTATEDYIVAISRTHEASARIDGSGAFEISTVSPLGMGEPIKLITAGGGLFLDGAAVASLGAGGDIKISGTVYADSVQPYTPAADITIGNDTVLTRIPCHIFAAVYVEANGNPTTFGGPDTFALFDGKTQTQYNKGMDTSTNARIANPGPAATFRANFHGTGISSSAGKITHSFMLYLNGNPIAGTLQAHYKHDSDVKFHVTLAAIVDMAQSDFIELWTATSDGSQYIISDSIMTLEQML